MSRRRQQGLPDIIGQGETMRRTALEKGHGQSRTRKTFEQRFAGIIPQN